MIKAFFVNWQNNPIVINELRSRMRGKRAFLVLAAHLIVLSGLIFSIYLGVYESTQYSSVYGAGFQQILEASAMLGKAIFYGISLLLLLVVSLIGPAFTAGAIVSEKERQTFDLLTITTLSPQELVMGKLKSILTFMGLLILATVPFLTMAYFFGGVAGGEIILVIVILLLTTLLFCSLGLFISSIARSSTIANMINYAIVIPLLLGVPFFLFFAAIFSIEFFINNVVDIDFITIIVVYITLILISINPLTMAVASQLFLEETGSYFFAVEKFDGIDLPIISPWILYIVFCLIFTYLFIKATISRVDRISTV